MKGTVKFFNEMKGFGFIAGDDGKEYFVHSSGLSEGTTIGENDKVTFDVEQGDRGPKAGNVAMDSGADDSAAEETTEEAEPEAEETAEEEAPAEEETTEEDTEEASEDEPKEEEAK